MLLCMVVLFGEVNKTKLHGDESGWIAAGNYHTNLLLERNFDWAAWQCVPCGGLGSAWASLNMQLGKILVGLPLRFYDRWNAGATTHKYFTFYDFHSSYATNLAQGRIPPPETLVLARLSTALFGVLCCLLLFLLGYHICNIWAGAIAATLLLINQLFIDAATRAMTDAHYNFFLLLFAFSTLGLIKAAARKQIILSSLVCGLCAGLACSIKINAFVIGTALFLSLLLYRRLLVGKPRGRDTLLALCLFLLSSLTIIYALNPDFWPAAGLIRAPQIPAEVSILRHEFNAGTVDRAMVAEKTPQLYNLSHVLEFPLLFHRWQTYLRQQEAEETGQWSGGRLVSLNANLFFTYASFPFDFVFFLLGLAFCIRAVKRSFTSQTRSPFIIPLLYFVLNYFFILAFMKLNWERYYLPTVIASRLLAGIGLYAGFQFVYLMMKHRNLPDKNVAPTA